MSDKIKNFDELADALRGHVDESVKEATAPLTAKVEDASAKADATAAAVAELREQLDADVKAIAKANSQNKFAYQGVGHDDPDHPKRPQISHLILGHLAKWDGDAKSAFPGAYEYAHEVRNWAGETGVSQNLGLGVHKATSQQGGFGSLGGLLIQPQDFPEVMEALRPASVVRSAMAAGGASANILEGLTGGEVSFTVNDGGITATRKGESKPVTPTRDTFSTVKMRPLEVMGLAYASRIQLAQDQGAIGRHIGARLGQELGIKMDYDAFLGDGGNTPIGFKNATAPGTATTSFSSVDYLGADQTVSDKLEDMKTALKVRNAWGMWGEPMWFANPQGFSKLRKSKDADGKLLGLFERPFGSGDVGVISDDRLMGLRYAESNHLTYGTAADDLLLIPVGAIYWAMWGVIEITPNELGDSVFDSNDIKIRATAYQDSAIVRGTLMQRAGSWDNS